MHKRCAEILANLEKQGKIKVNHDFQFPVPIPLGKKLKDVLEEDVDDKYYLSDKAIAGYMAHTNKHKKRGNGFKFEPTDGDVVAHAISTKAGQRSTDNYVTTPYRIRKLTPLEAYRLMGFSDIDFNNVKAVGLSDAQLFKTAGNSIVVDVLMAIFKELFKDGS